MSVDKAIELGEKAQKELAAKKEADRLASLSPEQKTAEEEKAKQIALQAEQEALLNAEDATLDEAKKTQKQELIAKNKAAQAEEEKRIISAKDEELNDAEKAKKAALLEKRKEDAFQRRIDEVVSKQKKLEDDLEKERSYRNKDQEKIDALEAQLRELKGTPEPSQEEIEKLELQRIEAYTEKDKALPRDKRREMTDSELEEWLVEDMAAANRWLARQELRRSQERQADIDKHLKDSKNSDAKSKAKVILDKQKDSKVRAEAKYPKAIELLNTIARKTKELQAQGKSKSQIQAIVAKEIPDFAIVEDVMSDDPDAYAYSEDGPERLAEAIQNKMSKPDKKETQEERDERIRTEAIEAERSRQASLPPHLRSNGGSRQEETLSDLDKAQFEIYQRSFPGKTLSDFKAMKKRRAEVNA